MKVAKLILLDDNYLFIAFWYWFMKLVLSIVLWFSMLYFQKLLLIWVLFGGGTGRAG